MTKKASTWFLYAIMGALLLTHCQTDPPASERKPAKKREAQFRISFDGKKRTHPPQEDIYQAAALDSLPLPLITPQVVKALQDQMQLLDYTSLGSHRLKPGLTVDRLDLIKTVHLLLAWRHTYPYGLKDELQLYRLSGEDQRSNVLFTGYYSPVLDVSHTPTDRYRYPIYRRPRDWEGPFPTRREIEQDGALDTLDLVVAWADNKLDIYLMQIQGSGYVRYPNGEISYFSYDGTNRHPYRSMEKFLRSWEGPKPILYTLNGIQRFFRQSPQLVDTVLFQNPSYTFFKPSTGEPHGAGSVSLTAGMSIAVDRRYIPLGSCLLAAVPVYDPALKRVTGHEYRLLFAQDVGGVIKGPGHVDLYLGAGDEAQKKAESLRHYGQLYLILPKK